MLGGGGKALRKARDWERTKNDSHEAQFERKHVIEKANPKIPFGGKGGGSKHGDKTPTKILKGCWEGRLQKKK